MMDVPFLGCTYGNRGFFRQYRNFIVAAFCVYPSKINGFMRTSDDLNGIGQGTLDEAQRRSLGINLFGAEVVLFTGADLSRHHRCVRK
jgi:hypothetical protein